MELLGTLHTIDLRLLRKIFRQGERRALVPMARALSRSGDGYLHLLLPLLVWALRPDAAAAFATGLGLALAMERLLYFLLKNSLRRRRPQDAVPGFRSLITASDQFSFPSGHTSAAFLLATCLLLVFGGPVAAMYLWAVGVGLSRVLLGVHFPGDILAGAAMGSTVALACGASLGLA